MKILGKFYIWSASIPSASLRRNRKRPMYRGCVCVYVCVCVWERERQREKGARWKVRKIWLFCNLLVPTLEWLCCMPRMALWHAIERDTYVCEWKGHTLSVAAGCSLLRVHSWGLVIRNWNILGFWVASLAIACNRMPYLHRSFFAKEPYNQWLSCEKWPATISIARDAYVCKRDEECDGIRHVCVQTCKRLRFQEYI